MLLAVSLLVAAMVYWPGLSGDFMFDDHWNIVSNPALRSESVSLESLQEAAASGRAGPLKRPVAMISFALNHTLWGPAAWSYKLVNLLVHLVTGGLVFLFITLLLSAREVRHGPWLAVAVASLWLLHPLNLTAVLYVVQRMTSLSALFVLASLCCYLQGRRALEAGIHSATFFCAALLLLMPLAVLSKETGALLPLYILLIEWLWFDFKLNGKTYPSRFVGLLAILIGIPCIVGAVLLLGYPELLLGGYEYRSFSLAERVLTQARVVWMYLGWGLLPTLQSLGLFHDDIALSSALVQPLSTLFAVLGWLLLLGLLMVLRRRAPLVVFGVLFFLTGHLLESTILPLELVFEHRNYLPLVGLLLAAVAVLQACSVHLANPRIAAAAVCVFAAYCGALTMVRAESWSNLGVFSMHQYLNHPDSARSNYQMGRIYAANLEAITDAQQRDEAFTRAVNHFIVATELRGDFVDGLFGLIVLYSSNGVEVPQGLLDELSGRLVDTPPQASTINQIINLWDCEREGVCELADHWLQGLIHLLRSNPAASPQLLALLPPSPADEGINQRR